MKSKYKYLILSIIIWVLVDFTTAHIPNFDSWKSFMPEIWIFYIGWPLLFSYLIYKNEWDDKKIFKWTMILGFLLEIIFFNNTMFFMFPFMLIAIPVFIAIYTLVTLVPKWIIEKRLKDHKIKIVLIIIWSFVTLSTYKNNIVGIYN